MEPKHAQRIRAQFPQTLLHKKPITLHIPDNYRYMDSELIQILEQSIYPHLEPITRNPKKLLQLGKNDQTNPYPYP